MSDWQPIETAPAQTPVLVFANGLVGEATLFGETAEWWWAKDYLEDNRVEMIHPTHWMPLPNPPAPSE